MQVLGRYPNGALQKLNLGSHDYRVLAGKEKDCRLEHLVDHMLLTVFLLTRCSLTIKYRSRVQGRWTEHCTVNG